MPNRSVVPYFLFNSSVMGSTGTPACSNMQRFAHIRPVVVFLKSDCQCDNSVRTYLRNFSSIKWDLDVLQM